MDGKNMSNKNSDLLEEVKYIPNGNETELKPVGTTKKRPDTLILYVSVFIAQLLIMVSGAGVTWSSPAIVILKSNNTAINPIGRPITTNEISLVAGVPQLAALAGSLVLPKLANGLGIRLYLLVMATAVLLSGLALSLCTDVIYIVISRCLIGFFLNGSWAVIPIYVTEICEDHNRGKFGCFLGFIHQVGHFISYFCGTLFGYKYFTLLTIAPAALFVLNWFWFPESPYYLLLNGKNEQCKKVLKKVRNNKTKEELEEDFNKLKNNLSSKTQVKHGNIFTLFKKRETRFALMLALLPLLTQHLSGVSVIMSFLAPLFNSAGTSLSGSKAAIIVSIIKTCSFIVTSLIVEKFGRRRLLLISSFGTSVPLFVLGVFFFLKHINSSVINYLQWLPLLGIISNVVMYSIGLGPIPMAIISELFPTELRTAASSFIFVVVGLIISGLTSAYPIIADDLGIHWCVWLFSVTSLLGGILIYIYLPETKGKSFKEIQELLQSY